MRKHYLERGGNLVKYVIAACTVCFLVVLSSPLINASSYKTRADEKIAYLTFDDGPSPITYSILDVLKKYNIKATFFVEGQKIHGNERALKRMVAEGHVIGGHTYSHNYQTIYKNKQAFFKDLQRGNEAIARITGTSPIFFRFPGGSTNTVHRRYQDRAIYTRQNRSVITDIIKESREKGLYYIDWNMDIGDTDRGVRGTRQMLRHLQGQMHGQKRAIVLMHDSKGKRRTLRVLPTVIHMLKKEGYSFRPITLEVVASPLFEAIPELAFPQQLLNGGEDN